MQILGNKLYGNGTDAYQAVNLDSIHSDLTSSSSGKTIVVSY